MHGEEFFVLPADTVNLGNYFLYVNGKVVDEFPEDRDFIIGFYVDPDAQVAVGYLFRRSIIYWTGEAI